MGTKNISISDEAYARLAALKVANESFTDVINRLTGRRSILELAGVLSDREADEMRTQVRKARDSNRKRVSSLIEEMR